MDGSWCPVTGSPLTDSLSFQHSDGASLEVKMRKGGVDVGINRTTVSADRRTMTGHWELASPDGTTITWETTSERQ